MKEARDRSPGSSIDLVNLDFLVVPGHISDFVDFKEANYFPDFLDFGRLTPVATEDVDLVEPDSFGDFLPLADPVTGGLIHQGVHL